MQLENVELVAPSKGSSRDLVQNFQIRPHRTHLMILSSTLTKFQPDYLIISRVSFRVTLPEEISEARNPRVGNSVHQPTARMVDQLSKTDSDYRTPRASPLDISIDAAAACMTGATTNHAVFICNLNQSLSWPSIVWMKYSPSIQLSSSGQAPISQVDSSWDWLTSMRCGVTRTDINFAIELQILACCPPQTSHTYCTFIKLGLAPRLMEDSRVDFLQCLNYPRSVVRPILVLYIKVLVPKFHHILQHPVRAHLCDKGMICN
jgi:hypothetical protein